MPLQAPDIWNPIHPATDQHQHREAKIREPPQVAGSPAKKRGCRSWQQDFQGHRVPRAAGHPFWEGMAKDEPSRKCNFSEHDRVTHRGVRYGRIEGRQDHGCMVHCLRASGFRCAVFEGRHLRMLDGGLERGRPAEGQHRLSGRSQGSAKVVVEQQSFDDARQQQKHAPAIGRVVFVFVRCTIGAGASGGEFEAQGSRS